MKITKLTVAHFEGLEALSFEPSETVNLIEGRNGAGKTSVLEAIRVAFTNRGHRSMLVRGDSGEGIILFELSDGTKGERFVTTDGRTAGPVNLHTRQGDYIPSPKSFLDNMGLGFGFNPLEFIELRTDKQTTMLLEVTPIAITLPELLALSGGKLPDVDYSQHPLQVLSSIAEVLEEKRAIVGRDARDAEGMTETLLEDVPAGFDVDAIKEFDLSHTASQLAVIETLRDQLAVCKYDQTSTANAILRLQGELADETAEFGKLKEQEIELTERLVKLPDAVELRSGLSTYKEQQEILNKIEESQRSADRAVEYRARYAQLQEDITAVRAKPGELLMEADLPVTGLGIGEDGKVTINGMAISELSMGEQIKVSTDIAIATLGDLKVVMVDGIEALDNDNAEYLLTRLTDAGVQAFVTRISDTELTIITNYTSEDALMLNDIQSFKQADSVITTVDGVSVDETIALLYGKTPDSIMDKPEDDVDDIPDDQVPWK